MISAVPPKEYGDRFLSFIRSVIRGNDPSQRVRVFFCWPYERKLIVLSQPRMYEHVPADKGKGPETEKSKTE